MTASAGTHLTRARKSIADCGFHIADLMIREKDEAMNEENKQQASNDKEHTGDSANNEVGPTEKLSESDKPEG